MFPIQETLLGACVPGADISLDIRPTSGKLSLCNWQILHESVLVTQKTSSDLEDQSSLVFLRCQPWGCETGYDTRTFLNY